MIHGFTRGAHRLDLWLQMRLGRPYNLVLGVGLTIEVVRRLIELPEHLGELRRAGIIVGLVAMNLALLVHQVGELSHHIGRREAEGADDHPSSLGGSGEAPANASGGRRVRRRRRRA